MSREYRLECCITSYEEAVKAKANGADRLEVCSRVETEGMTPDPEMVQRIIDDVHLPVRVMLRETEIGFETDELILAKMLSAIEQFKTIPIDGFVLGIVKNEKLDRDAMVALIEACLPLPITMHKALDQSVEMEEDIIWLNQFPTVDTLLTSGGASKATDGIENIKKIKLLFSGEVMAAGKIVKENVETLHQNLDLNWYHGRGIVG